jgi:hypothetical protein
MCLLGEHPEVANIIAANNNILMFIYVYCNVVVLDDK